MGSSAWHYFVPYQSDLNRALYQLRQEAFAAGDYHWPADEPRPATIGKLFAHEEWVRYGFHSILDAKMVLDRGEAPDYGMVQPLTAVDVLGRGGGLPTRDHAYIVDEIVADRIVGRFAACCTVLYDEDGKPSDLYFSGVSGT